MTVSITNLRRRMVTLLVPEGGGTRSVRIAAGETERGLPDEALAVAAVERGLRAGELIARRDPSAPAPVSASSDTVRSRKGKSGG